MLLYSTVFHVLSWATIVQLTATVLAIWAGWELNKSRLSVFPELKDGAQLINTGPYRIIRHPMYAALILFFIPTVLSAKGLIVVFLGLLTTLIFKMKYEEKILKRNFAEYEKYAQKSFYLIPFVY